MTAEQGKHGQRADGLQLSQSSQYALARMAEHASKRTGRPLSKRVQELLAEQRALEDER